MKDYAKRLKKVFLFLWLMLLTLPFCASGAEGPYIANREQLSSYLRQCAYDCRQNVSFSYGSALAGKMKDNGWLSQVLQENGISDASWRNDTSRGYLEFNFLTYYPEFYAQRDAPIQWFSTWQDIRDYTFARADSRDTDFVFFYDASLSLMENSTKVSSLLYSLGINQFDWEFSRCRIRIHNIQYEDQFALCRTEADMRDYLSWCARYQVKDFSLFLEESLYQKMTRDQFAALHALEGEARIVSCNLSYNEGRHAFFYTHTEYESGAPVCSSLDQIMGQLKAGAEQLQDSLHLFCSNDLYRQLVADNTSLLSDMASALGIETYSYSLNEGAGRIDLSNIRYRAGYKIYRAYQTGDYQGLTQREYDTLVCAVNILNGAALPTDLLGAERWIHDFLCDRIAYTVDNASDEDDCAVGALLNGRANCDGYADAFYLMGSLVGMEIRCQAGNALRSDGDSGHMWNLIRLNGKWYMVDVTWNDSDGGDPAHIWYNVGADFAKYSHTWKDYPGLSSMADTTENGYRPYPIYRCYSYDDLKNIMAECKRLGVSQADIFYGFGQDLYADTDRTYSVMRSGGVTGSIRSLWYDRPGFVHFYQLEY